LTACGGGTGSSRNEIGEAELSEDQREIVNMISIGDREVCFFDYQADESFTQAEFWVELYKDGVLVERPVETIMDGENYSRNGRISFILNDETRFKWSISTHIDGGNTSVQGREITSPGITNGNSRVFGAMDSTAIEKSKEIALYYMAFSKGNEGIDGLSREELENEPDILKKYSYVFLLKCKFE
jgi:hypothetical protein